MTQPPLAYRTPEPYSADAGQLRTLSILHYVLGGILMLFSSVFIFHVVIGLWLASGHAFQNQGMPAGQGPPPFVGYIMAVFGGCAICFGWTMGILNIISGRRIAARRSRVFSIVISAIDCMWFPFGTALGIFTIIVLARDSVKALYHEST
jgi:hypothetical protein